MEVSQGLLQESPNEDTATSPSCSGIHVKWVKWRQGWLGSEAPRLLPLSQQLTAFAQERPGVTEGRPAALLRGQGMEPMESAHQSHLGLEFQTSYRALQGSIRGWHRSPAPVSPEQG